MDVATLTCDTIDCMARDLTKIRAIMRRYRRVETIRAERDQEITALVDAGVPREQICREAGLTREQIRRIVHTEHNRRSTGHNPPPPGR